MTLIFGKTLSFNEVDQKYTTLICHKQETLVCLDSLLIHLP